MPEQNLTDSTNLNHDYSFKVVLLGDSGVGKTSLVLQYTENKFMKDTFYTIGVDFKQKRLFRKNRNVLMHIWDTAGQERFQSLSTSFYHNADAVFYVFDVTQYKSLDRIIEFWRPQFKKIVNKENVYELIVGNKTDQLDDQQPSEYLMKNLKASGIDFMFTSAKDNRNVDAAFEKICDQLIEIRDLEPLEFPMKDSFMLTEKGTDISGSSWFSCCGGATTEQIPTSQEENTGWFSGWW